MAAFVKGIRVKTTLPQVAKVLADGPNRARKAAEQIAAKTRENIQDNGQISDELRPGRQHMIDTVETYQTNGQGGWGVRVTAEHAQPQELGWVSSGGNFIDGRPFLQPAIDDTFPDLVVQWREDLQRAADGKFQ